MAEYLGVPIVRIDQEMCFEAARSGMRIGVLATLPTTLDPTMHTIARAARTINRHPVLVEGLIDGAFGLDQVEFRRVMLAKAEELRDTVDVLVLAQGSMQPTMKGLLAFESFLPQGDPWGVTHFGREGWDFLAGAIALGAAEVRIGFEDSRYLGNGIQAKHNWQLVERLRELIESIGYEVATPAEARATFGKR